MDSPCLEPVTEAGGGGAPLRGGLLDDGRAAGEGRGLAVGEVQVEVAQVQAHAQGRVFTWKTTAWTSPDADSVELTGDIVATLTVGDPDVSATVRYVVDPATQDRWYRHELRWESQPCQLNVSYEYRATSDGGLTTDHRTGRIKVCPLAE